MLSLRASAHTGVAIPRLEGKCTEKHPKMGTSAIFGGNRYLVPFNRGIATPVCGLVRNDRLFVTHPFKQRFIRTTPILYYKKNPLPCQILFGSDGEGEYYASFLVNHQASASALMPPVSFPTIMAGSASGAKPAV